MYMGSSKIQKGKVDIKREQDGLGEKTGLGDKKHTHSIVSPASDGGS